MTMLMMSIGIMLMRVFHGFMMMSMCVNRIRIYWIWMIVLVMRIMRMLVFVIRGSVNMFVAMVFSQVKP